MYQFRGRANESHSAAHGRPPLRDRIERRDDFSFRAQVQGPSFQPVNLPNGPRSSKKANPPKKINAPPQPRFGTNDGRARPQYQGNQKQANARKGPPNGFGRGGFGSRGASDRTILRRKRETTPERLEGMLNGETTFKAFEELSESEEDMELDSEDDTSGDEPAAKKARVVVDAAPKWSNPDPYTSLPPIDETQAKKKDVVKMIRKAKMAAETVTEPNLSLAADNADFISFDFGDDEPVNAPKHKKKPSTSSSGEISDAPPTSTNKSLPATNGIEKFSHLDHLHPNRHQGSASTIAAGAPSQHPSNDPRSFKMPPPTANVGVQVANNKKRLDLNDDAPSSDAVSQDGSRPQKRKRGGVDGGKAPRAPKLKNKKILEFGDILSEWQTKKGSNGTPWCTEDHSLSQSTLLWLHKEVVDFYEYVKPRDFEHAMRQDLVSRLKDALYRRHPDGTLYCFGSFAADLFLPSSDMDLVFVSDNYLDGGRPIFGNGFPWMRNLRDYLVRSGIAHEEQTEIISKARVPIIKFVDKKTNLHVDISFENMTGPIANDTFQLWKRDFPTMPILVTIVKQFLLMRGMNEVFVGGIGGFTVTCLVTSLLQHLPPEERDKMRPAGNLGELLMRFLDLYGNQFDLNSTGISMMPPLVYAKGAFDKVRRRSCISSRRI